MSSRSAERVCSTSRKPKALSRSSAAAVESDPAPASVSRIGAKNSFSWIDRTTACWRWCSTSNASSAGCSVRSRNPSTRARCVSASGSVGNVWVWCSSTSCRRCSTVRSHVYAVSSASRVRRADVAARRELLERVERGARTDRRIVAAVHELEQLHRELDVADPARPALDLAIRQALAPEHLLGARLHRARFADRVGVERVGPHEPRRTPDELSPERRGSRDRIGLDERLQLPVLRPAFPVRLEPLERATRARRIGLRAAARRRCGTRCRPRSAGSSSSARRAPTRSASD